MAGRMGMNDQALVVVLVMLLAGCVKPGAQVMPDTPGNVGGAPGVSATSVFAGEYDFTGPYARVLQPGPFAILPAERVTIPSDLDGEDILMGLHRPDTDERVPVVVMAGPYFDTDAGFGDVTSRSDSPTGPTHWTAHIDNFVPHGYAVVAIAVRGTGGSGGCNDLMGPDEAADLDQAITWLGEQDWSTGKVAMTGTSYDGSTPWVVASLGNPYLATIIPAAGVVDLYGLHADNGTQRTNGGLAPLYFAYPIAADTAQPEQRVDRIVCPEGLEGVVAGLRTGVDGTDATGYWQARDRRAAVLDNYHGSVFAVHGLMDFNVPSRQQIGFIDELELAGLRVKQLYGPWGHTYPGNLRTPEAVALHRADYAELLLRWLDRELKGLDVDTGAPVQVADSSGRWRNEAHYPPRDAQWKRLHLGQDGTLSEDPASRAEHVLHPVGTHIDCGASASEALGGFVDFTLAASDADLLIAGSPRIHVVVTPQGGHATLLAHLCERTADGIPRLLIYTMMDLAYADGTRTRTAVEPGQTIQALMQTSPTDVAIPAGSQLFLRISISPATAAFQPQPTLPITIEFGGDPASILEIPTIERGLNAYFDPPWPAP